MNHLLKPLSRFQLRQLSTTPVTHCVPKTDYGPVEVQRSKLLNGIRVAGAKPHGSVISACTIMYQAGSRYEIGDQIGATHFMRACSSASGCAYNSFFKMRVLQQYGASVTCTSDRQSVAYTIRCPMTTFPDVKYHFVDMARCCHFPWEVDDRKPLVHDDLKRIHPKQQLMDLIQTASWTGPLANSMFCPAGRINDMSSDILNCFTCTNYTSDELTIASVGLPYEQTMQVAELLEPKPDKPAPRVDEVLSAPRAGFEFLDTGKGEETYIAVAVPSCGTLGISNLLKHAVVAAACGTNDMIRGQHNMDRAVMHPLGTMAGVDVNTQYRAFTIAYKETGLFGILARTPACTAKCVALSASEFLTNIGDLDHKQLELGKARLKVNLMMHDEDCVKVSEGLALQIANDVVMDSARVSCSIVDQLSIDELIEVAKSLSAKSSQMSLAVVGDVGAVAHDGELIRI